MRGSARDLSEVPPRVLGRRLPRHRRVREQATLRQNAKGLQVATREPDRSRHRREPHTKHTYLQAQCQRLRARRAHARAIIAVAHSMLTATWHILSTGEVYTDPGGDYFARRDPKRTTRRLVTQFERLGHGHPRTYNRLNGDFPSDPRPLPGSGQFNREIGRRTDVVGIFPDDGSQIRLVSMLAIEANDEWLVGRGYISLQSMEPPLQERLPRPS